MHTVTIMEQQADPQAPPRSRPRQWLRPFLQRSLKGIDLVILECIAVALFSLLACTLLFSFLPR